MSIINLVAEQTDTNPNDWEFIDGPTTGVGCEYWLLNDDAQLQVYVAIDQGEMVALEVTKL